MQYGSVHGRFQPLHFGHLNDYILPSKEKCDHLIIGITNSDPSHILPDSANISRSADCNNPLNYFERALIIEKTLLKEGLNYNEFTIVPFPINYPQQIKFYLPEGTVNFLTIFDNWGEKKLSNLKHQKLITRVLYRKDITKKIISSTEVRERIIKGLPIRDLVPFSVVEYIENNSIRDRLVNLKMVSA